MQAPTQGPTTEKANGMVIRVANPDDREAIYRMRHRVYAEELGQHPTNERGTLSDSLDAFNTYILAESGGEVVGFISITPPRGPSYSIDKYFQRDELPLAFDDGLYELRILTVAPEHRNGPLAGVLMREAFRWVRDHGGRWIVIIGRREVADLYRKMGMRPLGKSVRSGAVTFDLMAAKIEELDAVDRAYAAVSARLVRMMGRPRPRSAASPACDHGGAFFAALGDEFDQLATKDRIVNADVLDAWFEPAPQVLEALKQDPAWMLRTSPPTGCEGLLRTIARVRGVPIESLVPGAGSSALIFLAFQRWLTRESRVLVLDPMYGEYAHVLEHVVGCQVDRVRLRAQDSFRIDLDELSRAASLGCDLVVLVNPNNPTGQHIPAAALQPVLERVPCQTRVWIDETYSEYAGPGQTLELFAAASANIVICKSLSKVLALSGARAAYLCGPAAVAADLRRVTPPWAVSLPAQVSAIAALKSPHYYAACYAQTHQLRSGLAASLRGLGLEVFDGVINSVLCRLPGPMAAAVVAGCRERGVFIRDCSSISDQLADSWVRVAVKSEPENRRVIEAIRNVLSPRS